MLTDSEPLSSSKEAIAVVSFSAAYSVFFLHKLCLNWYVLFLILFKNYTDKIEDNQRKIALFLCRTLNAFLSRIH